MRVLTVEECGITSGGGLVGQVATIIWQGIVSGAAWDAVKAAVNSVPTPNPISDEEFRRLQEQAERIKSTSPPPTPGGIDPGYSSFEAYAYDFVYLSMSWNWGDDYF